MQRVLSGCNHLLQQDSVQRMLQRRRRQSSKRRLATQGVVQSVDMMIAALNRVKISRNTDQKLGGESKKNDHTTYNTGRSVLDFDRVLPNQRHNRH